MKHKVQRLHFVGIGGVGMSGIAELMFNLDYQVTGSDLVDGSATSRLKSLGIPVYKNHDAKQIGKADVVVVSSAVDDKNPEVLAAKKIGVPVVPRALMLAELMRLRQGIAVAGTHGKTTTTSLISSVLGGAGLDPTYVIGGRLSVAGGNSKLGKGEFIVVEADESDASFLFLQPVVAVVTNIDSDHMETYDHNFENLEQAFYELIQRLPFYGTAVLCNDDPAVRRLIRRVSKPIITYGFTDDCDLQAFDVREQQAKMIFSIKKNSEMISGKEREYTVALNLLETFVGVNRRFQIYNKLQLPSGECCDLVDDYGHHPREIKATIEAARGAFPGRRILLVFQPHRFSRTKDCFEDFVKVLSTADLLVLTEVYSAGEAPLMAASGKALSRAIRTYGKKEFYFIEQFQDIKRVVLKIVKGNDIILVMGAGSISELPLSLVAECSE